MRNRSTFTTKVTHKPPKETQQTMQTTNFSPCSWYFNVFQTLQLVRLGIQLSIMDNMSKNFHSTQQKLTLTSTTLQIIIINQLQNSPSVIQNFFLCLTIYNNIINVHKATFIQQLSKNILHQSLKYSGCILMPKWHANKLICPFSSNKSQITLRSQLYSNLPKTFCKIKFGKILCFIT